MPKANDDFVQIDRLEVPASSSGPLPGARTQALIAGETIFVPGKGSWRNSSIEVLRRRGLRLRTRAHTRDGVAGFAAWTEALEPREP